jgi:hypothetical protein
MIRLSSTTQKLQAVLAGAVTTNELQIVVNYSDQTSTTYAGGTQRTNTNGATDVDICDAPAASTVRDIDNIHIYNRDTASADITVKVDVSGTEHILIRVTLSTLETLVYTHGSGWQAFTTTGKHKVEVGSGGGGGGSVTSNTVSAVSAQAASALSQALSVLSVTDAALSVRVDSVANAVSVVSNALSVGEAALSVRINSVANAVSVVSNAVSIVSTAASNALSVANAASQAASIVSQAVSVLSNQNSADHVSIRNLISIVSTAASNALSVANAASQATSALSQQNSVDHVSIRNLISIVSNAVSVGDAALSTRADSLANGISAISQRLSALVLDSLLNVSAPSPTSSQVLKYNSAASQWVASVDQTAGGASVTSTELSAVSAQAASALSQALSALSATDAGLSSRIDSVNNTLSQRISALVLDSLLNVSAPSPTEGQVLTWNSAAAQWVASTATGGGGGSVTSTELSAVSAQAASAISQLNSIVSSNAVGITRLKSATAQLVSAASLTNITSLVVTLAASTVYEITGGINFECGTSGGFAFGMSAPALHSWGSHIAIFLDSVLTQGFAGQQGGRVALSAIAAGQTIIASVSIATINSRRGARIQGVMATSAAGNLQLMAKTSVAGASMSIFGGYLNARRIGDV